MDGEPNHPLQIATLRFAYAVVNTGGNPRKTATEHTAPKGLSRECTSGTCVTESYCANDACRFPVWDPTQCATY